jgi:hypothetical protein
MQLDGFADLTELEHTGASATLRERDVALAGERGRVSNTTEPIGDAKRTSLVQPAVTQSPVAFGRAS